MAFSQIYVAYNDYEKKIVAVSDRDCLPDEINRMYIYTSTADMTVSSDVCERFYHYYDRMRWLEDLGFKIKIDFDLYYYETGWSDGIVVRKEVTTDGQHD
jgi:hypothetical protein